MILVVQVTRKRTILIPQMERRRKMLMVTRMMADLVAVVELQVLVEVLTLTVTLLILTQMHLESILRKLKR